MATAENPYLAFIFKEITYRAGEARSLNFGIEVK
jgi:hypothetical protein